MHEPLYMVELSLDCNMKDKTIKAFTRRKIASKGKEEGVNYWLQFGCTTESIAKSFAKRAKEHFGNKLHGARVFKRTIVRYVEYTIVT